MLIAASAAMADGKQRLTVNGEMVEQKVSSITFDGSNAVLHLADGSVMTADMEAVMLKLDYSTETSVYELKKAVKDVLHLDGLEEGSVVTVYDAQGKQVMQVTAREAKAMLSAKQMKSGVYMLKAGDRVVKFVKR